MYVHFLELWNSHFSEERSQNPTPGERLACLEVLQQRRACTIRRAKPRYYGMDASRFSATMVDVLKRREPCR
jgi:hypothetical protein